MSQNPIALAPRGVDALVSVVKSRAKTLDLCLPVLYVPINCWVNSFSA